MGDLTLGGSTLYGMTQSGGGNIFKIGTNGTGYQVLRSFDGGAFPRGSLTLNGSTLYGMTNGDGSASEGTIFSIDTNGSGFNVLHTFDTMAGDGGTHPMGDLTLSGSTLYGMAYIDARGGNGTIFSIGTDGTGYKILHSFSKTDGIWPQGDLTLVGSTMYGMTSRGGDSDQGTIFSVNIDGTDFQVLHSFAGGSNDGSEPCGGGLTYANSRLYGMTSRGGTGGGGVIFSITVPEPSSIALLGIGAVALFACRWRRCWQTRRDVLQ